ncbi:MAG TPA: SLBB domain-containing protein [Candidatus Limnocylindrales bacterium]|nr:SLBB domain-containing protein [Candidatus Limnocylindrales bacterium]
MRRISIFYIGWFLVLGLGVACAQVNASLPQKDDSIDETGASLQDERPQQRPTPGAQINNPGSEQDQQGQNRQRSTVDDRANPENTLQQRTREVQRPLPPEPDIEFQEFVTNSLGYRLRIFGRNLFQEAPSTFAPLDRVPVTPEYLIGPGDELIVRAWGQIEINNYHAVVDRNGSIYLPKVGAISVAGLRFDQLHEALRSAIGRVFRNFELSVTMGQLRSIQVLVVGQARRPGNYTVSSLSTLVNALFASGGPSNRGSMRHIELKRQGKTIADFDLYDLIIRGDKSHDVQLLPGDVIYIAPVGPLVAMGGSVNVPAIFESKPQDTVGDLLAYAGGLASTAAGQHALVERIDDRQVRRTLEIPLTAEGLKQPVKDGDVVRFLHISPRFESTVTIRGNVAVPGRYPWHEGMRVKDLIPNRDFLIREDYWRRQNRLGLQPQQPIGRAAGRSDSRAMSPANASDQRYPQDQRDQGSQEQRNSQEQLNRAEPVEEPRRIREEDLKNDIQRSAADINWQYAVIQRLNPQDLTTALLPFNLGKAIAGDPEQNLALQSGDIVTIFSQYDIQVPAAQRSKFIRLEGEFNAAGVYEAEPGETLRHLISRVGGFTPQAYLYGAEFTRESTREDQQRRLDQYILELEQAIERRGSGQRNLSADEIVAEQQAIESQRRLIERLRQLRATGRVVLDLTPSNGTISALPDLPLEDGDRLIVPFRPATVNVIGAVYNSGSFMYRPGKSAKDYLNLSGGANKDGDRGRIFVIRADGSTVGHSSSGFFTAGVESLRLMPGDSVVVPEKLDKGAGLRAFRDWTQIITQFVLGAAAVKVLMD